ncbi:MAG: hypothetical protein IJX62_04620 [Clostridia bacterium]|nr:hypothetical protein [Clostridia bacterium]
MLYPTIEELTQGKFNRYELALATAKCARLITNEYVRQHDIAEKSQTGNKETDRPINTMIDRELRDEKAVQVAINHIYAGQYVIDVHADEYVPEKAAEAEEVTEADGTVVEDEAEAEGSEEEIRAEEADAE